MEDEVEGLKLRVSSLETQLNEQVYLPIQRQSYEETISGLMRERRMRHEEEQIRRQHDESKLENMLDRLNKTRALCRENTRGSKAN
jgi:hypothetical protein